MSINNLDQVVDAHVSEEGLTDNEKIVAWIFNILNPVIAGGVMYFIWNKKYPKKAKTANNISMIVFVVEIILFILLKIYTH